MSISDRLAALGIRSEAVREYEAYVGAADGYAARDLCDAAIESLLDEVERLSTQRCATCSSLGSENDDTFVCRNVMAPAPMTDAELEDPGETWCCRWYRREG